jgi:hypothetical protein
MSFTSYVESRSRTNIVIILDEYKEKLNADMSSLLLKPNDQISEVKKNILNLQEMSKLLSEVHYPLANELIMAIRTGDSRKVSHANSIFNRWAENNKNCDKIRLSLFEYCAKLYGNKFGPEEVDEITNCYLAESKLVLDQMAKNIDLAISKIPSWKSQEIVIEAICPENDWIVNESKVNVGKSYFIYESTPLGYKVKNLFEDQAPLSLKISMQDLIDKLQSNPKYNKILTLYMSRPLSERKYFEIMKRDLSLGIKASIPNHVTLANLPTKNQSDIWKVRIEEKHLQEYLHEGDFVEYQIIANEAPIRWIERLNNEE